MCIYFGFRPSVFLKLWVTPRVIKAQTWDLSPSLKSATLGSGNLPTSQPSGFI